ncbi:MAG TPA: DUF3857 domain-containing protein [Steroidobacteraceae bacterium]|nr:DUF3857 domain-containing protein [Steroidobacteraceae bacterium]
MILLSDEQVRFAPDAVETYIDQRIRIQTPQGLQALGTIAIAWQPDADIITVHHLSVRRGTQVRDLLAGGQDFTVLRREDLLEQATLTGTLTAVLQPADLQVGDIIEFAYTRRHADPVVPDRPDLELGWANAPIQTVHFRAQWPKQMAMRWQLRDFKPALQETTSGDTRGIEFTLDGPQPLLQPTGAPARYTALRRVEITSFQSWPDVSRRMASLYVQASKLAVGSPLHTEVERIRSSNTDPKAQATAALLLVQEQIRYVLLAMNQGALVPATADETWQRRYGDCKAKTALLLALLRELGIDAEPVAVNSAMGDGIDRQLPGVGAFDHVLVRAQIGGKTYWLDGTRPGDRSLDRLQTPFFGWGLPLDTKGSELVRIQPAPLNEPQLVRQIDLDASAGVDQPVRFRATAVFRGDGALAVKLSQDNLDATQRDQGMRDYWRNRYDGLQLGKVTSSFDENTGALTWTAEGTLQMDWDDNNYHEFGDMTLGFKPDFSRPEGTDTEAPYAVSYPEYTVNRVRVKLPTGNREFSIYGDNIDKTVAGREYRRSAQLANAVFTAESSERSIVPEISAKDAHAAEAVLREIYKNGLYIQKPRPLPSAAELQQQAGKTLSSADDYIGRGSDMLERSMYEPAVTEFTNALKLEPNNTVALDNRALAYIGLKRTDEARVDLRKALELDPKDTSALGNLGEMALGDGHTAEAIDLLSRSLAIKDGVWARDQRATAYLAANDVEHAAQDLIAMIRADPNQVGSFEAHAANLMSRNRRDDVNVLAQAVLEAHAGPENGVAIAADLYRISGAWDRAHPILDDAISKAPSPELYFLRASVSSDADRMRDLDAAIKLDPKYLPALFQLAVLQLALGKYTDVLKTVDQLEATSPPTLDSHSIRAGALAGVGRIADAEHEYAAVRALAKTPAQLSELCWNEAIHSDSVLEDALKDCDAALAASPGTATILGHRGFVLLKSKRYAEAIATYDAAHITDAGRADQAAILFGRGIAKLRLGRNEEGEADMNSARNILSVIEQVFAVQFGIRR